MTQKPKSCIEKSVGKSNIMFVLSEICTMLVCVSTYGLYLYNTLAEMKDVTLKSFSINKKIIGKVRNSRLVRLMK